MFDMHARVKEIAEQETYSQHLGIKIVSVDVDQVVLKLPYQTYLGTGRVHGGAISSVVDLAGTCACWAHPDLNENYLGATLGFSINFLSLVRGVDLIADAHVRRRGGSICVADISVSDGRQEVSIAQLTYKLNLPNKLR
ncbi:MAG: PaaI family thioesterase [Gammaproteobacteria bacterium]